MKFIVVALLLAFAAAHRAEDPAQQSLIDDPKQYMSEQQLNQLIAQQLAEQSLQEEEEIEGIKDWKKRWHMKAKQHGLEFFLISLMLVAALTFIAGRHVNRKRAHVWLQKITPIVEKQFPKAGAVQFDEETHSEFQMVISGRPNVVYLSCFLALEKRFELTAMTLRTFFSPCVKVHRDVLLIDIPIQRENVVHSEILVVQPGELKQMKQQQVHIDLLLRQFDPNGSSNSLSRGLLCYGETQDSIDSFFSNKHVIQLLGQKKFSKTIMMLHLTDLFLYNDFDTMLRVKLCAKQSETQNHAEILDLLLHVADFLASREYKVPTHVQTSLLESRKSKLQKAKQAKQKKN